MSWKAFLLLLLLSLCYYYYYIIILCCPLQAFIPDAKDALEEVDVLKKEALTEMDKQMGRKEASPG